jgi:Spy/CpxP family protein refolding chaperone
MLQDLISTLLLAVTCLFLSAAQGHAAEYAPLEKPTSPLLKIMEQLNLSAEQQSTVQPIILSDWEMHRAIFEKYRPGREESEANITTMQSELQVINQETSTRLTEVLTAEQMAQYSELRAKLEQRMEDNRHHGSPVVRILNQLSLTQEQWDAVAPIIKNDRNNHHALMDKGESRSAESQDTTRSAMDALDRETEAQLAEVLPSDQMIRYAELRDEMRSSMPPPPPQEGGMGGPSNGRSVMSMGR